MRPHLTVEQRQLALRLRARGLSLREIGPQVGCSHEVVRIIARQAPRRPVRQDGWVPGPGRLTLADREEISIGLRAGESFTAIAARLGKAVSTVSRGGGRQRRAGCLPGVAGSSAGPPAGPAAQDCQAGLPRAGRPGHRLAGAVVVAGADLAPVADRVPARSHDAGEPRDDLPGPVRAGPRRAAPGAGPLPAHRPGQAPPARPRREHRAHQGHGDDQRPPRRGRRPGRARPLGRRPDHRQGLQVRDRHPGRTDHPLRAAAAPAARPRRAPGRASHAPGDHRLAR